jgi:hypothetical protein
MAQVLGEELDTWWYVQDSPQFYQTKLRRLDPRPELVDLVVELHAIEKNVRRRFPHAQALLQLAHTLDSNRYPAWDLNYSLEGICFDKFWKSDYTSEARPAIAAEGMRLLQDSFVSLVADVESRYKKVDLPPSVVSLKERARLAALGESVRQISNYANMLGIASSSTPSTRRRSSGRRSRTTSGVTCWPGAIRGRSRRSWATRTHQSLGNIHRAADDAFSALDIVYPLRLEGQPEAYFAVVTAAIQMILVLARRDLVPAARRLAYEASEIMGKAYGGRDVGLFKEYQGRMDELLGNLAELDDQGHSTDQFWQEVEQEVEQAAEQEEVELGSEGDAMVLGEDGETST